MITSILTGILASALLVSSSFITPPKASVELPTTGVLNDYNFLKEKPKKQTLSELLSINYSKPAVVKPVLAPTVVQQPTVVVTPTVTMPTAAPTQPVVVEAEAPKVLTEEQITHLGTCEAGMDPAKNTGNGYYGAFQFSYGTWKSMNTGYERADLAPIEVQKDAVQRLVQRSSIFTQFPACAKRMRLIGMI